MTRKRGFTLIEMMIVLAIIAILAAIAYPAYSRYAYRARRDDGKNLLMHIATAEERHYSTYNQYTDDLTDLGYASENSVPSQKGYYTASVATPGTGSHSRPPPRRRTRKRMMHAVLSVSTTPAPSCRASRTPQPTATAAAGDSAGPLT